MTNMPPSGDFDNAQPILFPNSPDQLKDAILVAAHDWDGTMAQTYPAMCIVDVADKKLPDIFSDVLFKKNKPSLVKPLSLLRYIGYMGKKHRLVDHPKLAEYFAKRTAHANAKKKEGEPLEDKDTKLLSQIEFLFAEEEHKNVLHRPMDTFDSVVRKVFADLQKLEIEVTPRQRAQIEQKIKELKKDQIQLYVNEANLLYPGVVEALEYSAKAGTVNAVYTTTEAPLIVLRIHDAQQEKGVPFDHSLIAGVWAFEGKGGAKKIVWDGSWEGWNGYREYLKEQGIDLAKYNETRLREIYNKTNVFDKKKPNNKPLLAIWDRFMTKQVETVNKLLQDNGYKGAKEFVATMKNMLFIGESKSDQDSTLSDLANPDSPRICRFMLQWTGLQNSRTIRNDSRIRDAVHLLDEDGTIRVFGPGVISKMLLEKEVLVRGYRTLRDMMRMGDLKVGFRDMFAVGGPTHKAEGPSPEDIRNHNSVRKRVHDKCLQLAA
jgi:hypothetical protein